ncbi:ketopantoate reductase [Pseudoxanthomonas sp. GM95]|uniref:2-dehydropantoate 2-reductase n=1 Tax=Pseudoxanthomonas sp. GM95 TaxID=1881043 RepID=UPI0008AE7E52|nr:2-dehydropantoate 2-reductase [Pseudoxanthomonas sp. GM95]SEM25421.1 ketopantoate reductase [Pseudoxanthomonas sp. GM95]
MRILVLGAGGTGGYFGGRLAQADVDVTFLVRDARAAQLQRDGLVIKSPLGDAQFPVAHVTADALPALAAAQPFDVVLLSCKAYDLDSSLDAIAPAVGANTTVFPILNGLQHYAALDAHFGAANVLGGLCFISAMKGEGGEVLHLGKAASITFGERRGEADSPRTLALAALFQQAGVQFEHARDIALAQWSKYSFLTALAAATCLMRGSVGAIVAAEGGRDFMIALYRECVEVAKASGVAVPETAQVTMLEHLTRPGSDLTASMLRDLQSGQRVEAAHIVGDMVHRAAHAGLRAPRLETAWIHLQVFEANSAG